MSSLGTPSLRLSRTAVMRYVYAGLTLLVILSLIPSSQKFKYDYQLGKPWSYDDLKAPFAFPILKSPETLEAEKENIRANFEPFYVIDTTIAKRALRNFEQSIQDLLSNKTDSILPNRLAQYRNAGRQIIKGLYAEGIVQLEQAHRSNTPTLLVLLGNNAKPVNTKSLYQMHNLVQDLEDMIGGYAKLDEKLLQKAILRALQPNITYEENLSKKRLKEELDQISKTTDMVNAGELIVAKGFTISENEYRKLVSLETQYKELVKEEGFALHLTGYIILVVLVFLVYLGYIQLFQIQLIKKNRRLLLLLITIVFFVFITRYTITHEELNVFLIPYCIVPIVILAFFEYKLALITHIVVILIVGSFININESKFIIIQLVAGFTAILTMVRVQYLSRFFVSALIILAGYVLSYFAFELTEISNLKELRGVDYMWLVGNFMLTLLAYPLIFAYEKMFGFVSDITLVELSDINKKLLRRLSVEAPGTFQHSLQVANLSESVINKIGGKALLTRVGALYHDIGKMANPEYFIENQKYIDNPHKNLNDGESAEMIISHVTQGVKMAKQVGLPNVIIDFIRTHHGQSRVEYFYRNYLKKVPAHEVDESKFRYPGPKPATREMAVVMICDSVEAATRSIQQKDAHSIGKMIDNIIDGKINDRQLETSPITLSEIETIRELLKDLINSMYHVRIAYPEA